MKMDEVDGKNARNLAVLYWKKSKDVAWEMFRIIFRPFFSVLQCVVYLKLSEIREKILVFAEF